MKRRILPGHHGHEQIDEWLAQRAVSDSVGKVVFAFIGFGCLIGAYYTAGPVDKTVPIVFYILREMFGENTCIGFFVAAIIFALMSKFSGTHIDDHYNNSNSNGNGNH